MVKTDRIVSTADVLPIEDVYKALTNYLVRRIKSQSAAWGTLHECKREIEFHKGVLEEDDLPDYRRWFAHGHIQMASRIIRKLADEFKIPNFRE